MGRGGENPEKKGAFPGELSCRRGEKSGIIDLLKRYSQEMDHMNITLQNLTKRFPARGRRAQGEVTAVEDLSFQIPDGMLVGLLGPSGCGKSTTLNMICGLETPTEGKIFFGEEDVTAPGPGAAGGWGWCSRTTRCTPT